MDVDASCQISLGEEGLILLQETISSVKTALQKVHSLQRYIENQQTSKVRQVIIRSNQPDTDVLAVESLSTTKVTDPQICSQEISKINSYDSIPADPIYIASSTENIIHCANGIYPSNNKTLLYEKCIPSSLESWHVPEEQSKPVDNLGPNTSPNVSSAQCTEESTSSVGLADTSVALVPGVCNSRQLPQSSLETQKNSNASLPNTISTNARTGKAVKQKVFDVCFTTPNKRLTENALKHSLQKSGLDYSLIRLNRSKKKSFGYITFPDSASAKRAAGMKLMVENTEVSIKNHLLPRNKCVKNIKRKTNLQINGNPSNDKLTTLVSNKKLKETRLFSLSNSSANLENSIDKLKHNINEDRLNNLQCDNACDLNDRQEAVKENRENNSISNAGVNSASRVTINSDLENNSEILQENIKVSNELNSQLHLLEDNTALVSDCLEEGNQKSQQNSNTDILNRDGACNMYNNQVINEKINFYMPYGVKNNISELFANNFPVSSGVPREYYEGYGNSRFYEDTIPNSYSPWQGNSHCDLYSGNNSDYNNVLYSGNENMSNIWNTFPENYEVNNMYLNISHGSPYSSRISLNNVGIGIYGNKSTSSNNKQQNKRSRTIRKQQKEHYWQSRKKSASNKNK